MTNSILKELKYPFGNRLLKHVDDPMVMKAINNVLKLAKERVWLAKRQENLSPGDLLQNPDYSEDINEYMLPTCERSLKIVEELIDLMVDETQK